MLIAYEDNIIFIIFSRLQCKIGKHREYLNFGGLKIPKYYCQICGKPRKHPDLKVVDGNDKKWDNDFKF